MSETRRKTRKHLATRGRDQAGYSDFNFCCDMVIPVIRLTFSSPTRRFASLSLGCHGPWLSESL